MRETGIVWRAAVVMILAIGWSFVPAEEPARPASFDDFDVVGFAQNPEETSVLILDAATINRINCGCTDCSSCSEPEDTYLYFPTYVNEFGDPKSYWIEAGRIQIDRPTSLYLSGADQLYSRLRIRDADLDQPGPSPPVFSILRAPLVRISNFRFWPDPGYRESNDHPDGPVAVRSANTAPVRLELLDTFLSSSKLRFDGPGTYRLQNVTAEMQGSIDAVVDIDNADADVVVVGGLLSSSGPHHTELPTSKVITTCLSTDKPAAGTPPECACGADGCDTNELAALDAVCLGETPPSGCPYNPCDCDSNFVRQRQGRLRMFGTALISVNGRADIRLDSPAEQPHAVVAVRSEGTKCTTGYPSTHVWVPPTNEPVAVYMLSSVGGWGPHAVGYLDCPPAADQLGINHFIDYNASGTVWLIGNTSARGAGRLAVGTAPGATVLAVGNRYFGNRDDGGEDPKNLLPMNPGSCAISRAACNGGEVGDCPLPGDSCAAPHLDRVTVGNIWSRGDFCDWCASLPAGEQVTCDDECDGFSHQPADTLFVDANAAFTDFDAIPRVPDIVIPPPLTRPPVGAARFRMIDAAAECRDQPCVGYYPDDCGYCIGGNCTFGQYMSEEPVCWIQAALYKGLAEGKPVWIPEGVWEIPRPLYWVHSDQLFQGVPLPNGTTYPGGWIVGQNNNVTIRNTDPEAVWTTEGMSHGVIQGIAFETAAYTGVQQHSTLDLENNRRVCGLDPVMRCAGTADCNVCEGGTCASDPGRSCANASECVDECQETVVGRQTASVVFHDCSFRGGRHALGICVDSPNQCDTVMTVNGTFADAHIGWATGGWNALHNIAYNATLTDNEIAMGHDDVFTNAGQGNWAAMHATVTSNVAGARDINLQGSNHAFYFHGLRSENEVVMQETLAQNRSYAVVFDHAELAKSGVSNSYPMIDYRQAFGPLFVHSDLGRGWVRLADSGSPTKARGAFKLESRAPDWYRNELPDESPDANADQTSRLLELEFCETRTSCAPCRLDGHCFPQDTGDTSCLDTSDGEWTVAGCDANLTFERCFCVGRRGQTCPLFGETDAEAVCP